MDVDTVTFEFGSVAAERGPDRSPDRVADAIRRALSRNPDEIFLIEGHTDAVGPEVDNLTLSDRRAETVATILTERFGVAAENLTTQGYGAVHLKVNMRRSPTRRTGASPSGTSRRCCASRRRDSAIRSEVTPRLQSVGCRGASVPSKIRRQLLLGSEKTDDRSRR